LPHRRRAPKAKPRIAFFDDPGSNVARSCTSKDAYESQAHARAVALMNGLGDSLTAYECRHCGNWHLTRRRSE
jgi:hypothetical protein